MNAKADISVVSVIKEDPSAIFRDAKLSVGAIVSELEANNENAIDDLGTDKGRKAIASRAHAVTKLKTSMDGAGKELNAGKRAEIEDVDKIRRQVREELDALKSRIRKPLDNWEAQEQARKDEHAALIAKIDQATFVSQDDTSATIGERIQWLENLDLSEASIQEFSEAAKGKAEFALNNLRAAHENALKAEAEREELERLRKQQAEQAAREAQERDVREAKEREEAQKRAAAEAEERRKREAAEMAARAAEQARKEAEEKAERERQALIEAQERKERERIEAERKAQAEAEKKARNKAHRRKINNAALAALQDAGNMGEPQAKIVLTAIASGEIPYVSINY